MTDEPAEHALHARFLRGLAIAPHATALRVGERLLSYQELHETALAWAGALLAADERPAAVGVLADKGVTAYAGILAGLYAGTTVVPLNPRFPTARTRRMLEVSGAAALIADESGLSALAEAYGSGLRVPVLAPGRDGTGGGRFRELPLRAADAQAAPCPVSPSDTAYVLFTSGSTGQPKGVPISHGSTHHYFQLLDKRYDFHSGDAFSQTFDVNFDCAMFDMFCAWGAGASLHPVPARAYRDLPGFFAERGMTVWFSTPSAIALTRRMGGLVPDAMPTLRWSLFAGEGLRADDAADWQAAAPRSAVENLYGPTELTVTVTGHRWSAESSPALCGNGLVPIGRLHEGHELVLLDEDGRPGAGPEGELCVTGPQMTAGYLDPEDNPGRFLEHAGRTWYRTGDRVRVLDGGELLYLGRLDAQVQIQGWRVELAEVEHAVRACDGVQDAVAVTRPAHNSAELVVFYTGTPTPGARLAARLRDLLPHGMVPRHFRHVAEFPLNSNRKIDRARLAREALDPRD